MYAEPKKVCKECNVEKSTKKFESLSGNATRNICMQCRGVRNRASLKSYYRAYDTYYRKRHPESQIMSDSRRFDRKSGFENDLDKDFIKDQISKSCSYCGESTIKMTLDRIDNGKGHTKDNVVPACIRCNLTRRDMPHEAWKFLVDGMTRARESGAFGDWTAAIKRK